MSRLFIKVKDGDNEIVYDQDTDATLNSMSATCEPEFSKVNNSKQLLKTISTMVEKLKELRA